MHAWQATVQDEAGNIIPLPVVTVYLNNGTTLASIYSEEGDPLPNPLTGTMDGFVQFWVESGKYKILGAKGGDQTEVWSVTIATPAIVLTPEEFGAIGDGVADDTAALQASLNSLGYLHLGKDGRTYRATRLTVPSGGRIEGKGTIDFSGNASFSSNVMLPLILARGYAGEEVPLTADAKFCDWEVKVASTTGVRPGDLVEISTPGHNGGFIDTSSEVVNAEMFTVQAVVDANTLRFTEPVLDEGGFTVANGAVMRRIDPLDDLYFGPDVTIRGKGAPPAGAYGDIGLVIMYGRRPRVHCQFEDIYQVSLRFESCYDYEASGQRLHIPERGIPDIVADTFSYGIACSSSSKYGRVSQAHFHSLRSGVVTSHLNQVTIDPTYGTPLKMRGAIRFLHIVDCVFVNCWISGATTHNDADLVTVSNCRFVGCERGISFRERRLTARNNTFQSCKHDIYMTTAPRDILIENNTSAGKKGGSFITTVFREGIVSGITIRNNVVKRVTGGRGIFLDLVPAGTYRDFVIEGNLFENVTAPSTSDAVIYVGGAPVTGMSISRNIVRRSNARGIRVGAGGTNIFFMGNDISGTPVGIATSGTYVNSFGKGNILVGNNTGWSNYAVITNGSTITQDNTVVNAA